MRSMPLKILTLLETRHNLYLHANTSHIGEEGVLHSPPLEISILASLKLFLRSPRDGPLRASHSKELFWAEQRNKIAHLIFLHANSHFGVSRAGLLRVRTVQTQREVVNRHPQIMSTVLRPSGELCQPSRPSVLLLADIEFARENILHVGKT